MDHTELLIVAMAERCRCLIQARDRIDRNLPAPLQPAHLQWMCEQIEAHADGWSPLKLHRWLGFIQGALIAHRILDLPGAKAMFNADKIAYEEHSENLVDHLDPYYASSDLGGEA